MNAMVWKVRAKPLFYKEVPVPTPSVNHGIDKGNRMRDLPAQTLHVVDGELNHPKLPLIPGHVIIGKVVFKAIMF